MRGRLTPCRRFAYAPPPASPPHAVAVLFAGCGLAIALITLLTLPLGVVLGIR